jgi:hypothetical protein
MKKEKEESEWGTICTPIKTDWHFVILMLCLGVLGITMAYVSKHVGEIGERVSYLELKAIKNDPLPQQRAEQPTMFEGLGINKEGEVDE